ncbi:RrF2 family transcriptional regulator [Pelagovum pacificum]|uniref:Rrf2 family transcriptional regulator n=1 Tax=Pelagovum pacificum TaxID=2588711 RepID=A0A5C5G997_9RHOB|nr:Rrf2 family transcriptional regulator [Pelagovum pacificum]QQA42222.1 Rrf2 family transcriptional regulator [Pelagovum pacificum]TNY31308.1 Rrf2 family transcriptional regulator [Pelagovum pacificum]
MHLTKFTDYALRSCLYLAAHPERLVNIAEISKAHRLSHPNLMKVVRKLVDGGFLQSTRGRSGGISLARPAEEIRVGELARYMEGDTQMVDCSTCILLGSCGLVRGLNEAKMAFYKSLDRFSLADAVGAHPRTLPILRGAAAEA